MGIVIDEPGDGLIKIEGNSGNIADVDGSGNLCVKVISANDNKIKITSNDTTADYLQAKVTATEGSNTTNILETYEVNDAGDEDLELRIDQSKISITESQISDLSHYTHPNHTGDVTSAGDGAQTIANNAVTNAKLADVPTQTFKGRITAATGDPEDLTVAQAKTLLNLTGTNSGDQTITLTGDVTGSGTGSFAATIANNAVTLAKMAQIATARILGRVTAGTGNVEELTGTQATTLFDLFTSTLKGLVPGSGGGTTNFLRADGTWAAPPGGGGSPWTKSGTTLYPATNGDFVRIGDQNTATAPIDVVSSQAGFLLKLQNLLNSGELIEGINDNGNTIFQVNTNVSSHGIMRVFQDNGEVTLSADTGSVKIGRRTDDVDFNWPLLVMGDTTGGNGFKVMAGENLGDIAFHIADQDDTFQILELEADQGFMTLGKTYAQTLIDNGVVYGVDIQHPGAAKDFNTQNGTYRIAGVDIAFYFEYPIWAEESTALNDGSDEWSFGNGAVGNGIGIPIASDGEIFAVGYQAEIAGTSTVVQVEVNGVAVADTGPQSGNSGLNTLGSPIAVSAGDVIGFKTLTAGGASDCRVVAWIRRA